MKPSPRNHPLDFTKGSLVVLMVLYHWYNYFVSTDAEIYRYLRFLTPSFIFISGYIVSAVYLMRPGYDGSFLWRLVTRGMKLLLLFVALNVAIGAVLGGSAPRSDGGFSGLLGNAYGIFVTGTGRAVFDVLVPIAYFLMLAPVTIAIARVTRIRVLTLAFGVTAVTLGISVLAETTPMLELMCFGFLGLGVGALPQARIDRFAESPLAIAVGYAGYLAAVTIWNVRFGLQLVGVCLSLLVLYLVGTRTAPQTPVVKHVDELGKYSLFAYIVQIAILQALRSISHRFDARLVVPTAFIVALMLTMAAVRLTSISRGRSTVADLAYRAVFA